MAMTLIFVTFISRAIPISAKGSANHESPYVRFSSDVQAVMHICIGLVLPESDTKRVNIFHLHKCR